MSNYTRGRAAEYRRKHKLEAEGWTVFRTAGSHGAVDLICVRRYVEPVGGCYVEIRWEQLKQGGKPTKQARDELAAFKATAQGRAWTAVYMVHNGKVLD